MCGSRDPDGRSVDDVQTDDAMNALMAAWRGEPEDRRAVPGVRAALLVRYADAIDSGAIGAGELLGAACNLMERIGEGTVEPNAAVVDALGEAVDRMEYGDVGELVERLDAYASGLTDLEFGDAVSVEASAYHEPPLLTVRDDGLRVKPGSFEAAASEAPPSALPVVVDAWKAVGDDLRGQLASVLSIAGSNSTSELHRLAVALQGAIDATERLNRILAKHVRHDEGLG